jgi:hypothetical protein
MFRCKYWIAGDEVTLDEVPLLDLKPQCSTIRSEIREAIERVVESQHFILWPDIAAFYNMLFWHVAVMISLH